MNLTGFIFTVTFFLFVSGITKTDAQTLRKETLNIGLLISNKDAQAAVDGAQLAISKANKKGGFAGSKFNLVVRSTEGLWGAGSIQSVGLVFDDNVLAIVGSLDGRNAHLAEQVTAKTRVAFLSSHATDMTLSGAFVPWYFRCVPNDLQQANALFNEIYINRKLNNIIIVKTESYDSKQAAGSFIKVVKSNNLSIPKQFVFSTKNQNDSVFYKIKKLKPGAIILFGEPQLAKKITPLLNQKNPGLTIFGTLSILDNQKAENQKLKITGEAITVSSNQWFTEKGKLFQEKFQEEYGYQPGQVAAYAYDGINIIIKTIRKSGVDRDRIIDAFKQTNYTGVTGKIRFDKNGNRTGKATLMLLKYGIPQRLLEK